MAQENVKIETLRQGAVLEVANDALQKIMDENTSPKVKRKLVLEIVFSPDEGREEVDISIAAKRKGHVQDRRGRARLGKARNMEWLGMARLGGARNTGLMQGNNVQTR